MIPIAVPANVTLFDADGFVVLTDKDGYVWIEVDGVEITQAAGHGGRHPGSAQHLLWMARQWAKARRDGWRIKVGKNGRLYESPPLARVPEVKPLTPSDVLMALVAAAEEFGDQYYYAKWQGGAEFRHVVSVFETSLTRGNWEGRALEFKVSGALRRAKAQKLVRTKKVKGGEKCCQRRAGPSSDTMWFPTKFGLEVAEHNRGVQQRLIESALAR